MRTVILDWAGLEDTHCDGDRLSIFVRDKRTGKMKYMSCSIDEVAHEGEPGYDEALETYSYAKTKIEERQESSPEKSNALPQRDRL